MKTLSAIRLLLAGALLVLITAGCSQPYSGPDRFGIYISTLEGSSLRPVIQDPWREMNHARVSPDGKWVVFTRYNRKGSHGEALETGGYEETEIMVVGIDGTGLRTLVPPQKGKAAANGYWTPDGKGILFVSNDNPQAKPEVRHIDFPSGTISRVPTPAGLSASDPHQVGKHLVFPAEKKDEQRNVLWLMEKSGKNARQVTHPKVSVPSGSTPFQVGDYDPKLSPDGSKVAFMRYFGDDNWHIMVLDVQTGKERDLSEAVTTDGVPEWSGDGKLVIFFHVDKKNHSKIGIYTVKPDGSGRKKVPLPPGLFYTTPAFFPGSGSGPDARIILSASRVPGL